MQEELVKGKLGSGVGKDFKGFIEDAYNTANKKEFKTLWFILVVGLIVISGCYFYFRVVNAESALDSFVRFMYFMIGVPIIVSIPYLVIYFRYNGITNKLISKIKRDLPSSIQHNWVYSTDFTELGSNLCIGSGGYEFPVLSGSNVRLLSSIMDGVAIIYERAVEDGVTEFNHISYKVDSNTLKINLYNKYAENYSTTINFPEEVVV